MIDAPPSIALAAIDQPAHATCAWSFRDEAVLGTRMQIEVVAATFDAARHAALAARAEIDRLNLILNSRRADSELVRLNETIEHRASLDLYSVIAAAEHWRQATGSAFSGRLGHAIDLWRAATNVPPDAKEVRDLAEAADAAPVILDPDRRVIVRPVGVRFALDGIAKGYVVDQALTAARSVSGVSGALVDIGGEIAAWGAAPAGGWTAGVPDPRIVADNAPLMAGVRLDNSAIATSGRGPRDRLIQSVRYSPTLDPRTGQPVERAISASVSASTTMEADALASALLVAGSPSVLPPGTAALLTFPEGAPVPSPAWRRIETPPDLIRVQAKPPAGAAARWHDGWQALATFTAPRRQLIRDPGFRSPYLAMWLTTPDNKPVRTLLLIGTRAEWQKDNFVWWGLNRNRASRFVSTRSMSTSGAGVYNVFWDGLDDDDRHVAPGKYILHVETSRERGKHTHRSLALDFTHPERFRQELPTSEESGGLVVVFDHY